MGFERRISGKMPGVRVASGHNHSESFSDKRGLEEETLDPSFEASDSIKLAIGYLKDCMKSKRKQSPNNEVQNSLRQEILQLEIRLQEQLVVRRALEKALGYQSSSHEITGELSMPKSTAELIKEITVLELEVVNLEQYLLSLYRKAFDQKVSSFSSSKKIEKLLPSSTTQKGSYLEVPRPEVITKRSNPVVPADYRPISNFLKESNCVAGDDKLLDSVVHRCHSSLSQHSAVPTRIPPPAESLDKAVRACQSQPLSMMEYSQIAASNVISLAEHLGTRISDHIPDTPNKISEDMIRCMSAIFCKIADPPLTANGLSSPSSYFSSSGAFSPKDQCDMFSPKLGKDSVFDVQLDNPFHVEGLKEFSGPYCTMLVIQGIYRDSQNLGDIEHMLHNFRSLIYKLEEIDPRKMKHEEKLAFWINIHNALVMHAFLAYGIPQNNVKRIFLLLKAAYSIGGHIITADVIQSSILGCRLSRPGQWLRLLLPSRGKIKAGEEQQAYALEHPEPLLHFALCLGSHSDPAVRVYTPKRVSQELEAAKEEYIRATLDVRKEQKVMLPKIVESFAKDSGLCQLGIMEMIQQSLTESARKNIKKCQLGKSRSSIEWLPHNFAFRYLIPKELAK